MFHKTFVTNLLVLKVSRNDKGSFKFEFEFEFEFVQ